MSVNTARCIALEQCRAWSRMVESHLQMLRTSLRNWSKTIHSRFHPSQRMASTSAFDSLIPPGFSAIKASPGSILLPLTISNKCGQSFRWRSVKVWEPQRQWASKRETLAEPPIKQEPGEAPSLFLDSPKGKAKAPPMEEWTEWSICLADRVVVLRQDAERGYIYHKTLLPTQATKGQRQDWRTVNLQTALWVEDYLNLNVPLESLYDQWAAEDDVFARFATKFRGIRMLRQDPWECLCSFICSSNNNIARIGQMVQNLCTHYSPRLLSHTYNDGPSPIDDGQGLPLEADGRLSMTIDYHPFPSPESLAQPGVEEQLRALGFGYRAKYIHQTAIMLCERCSSATGPLSDLNGAMKSEPQPVGGHASLMMPDTVTQVFPSSNAGVQTSGMVYQYLYGLRSLSYAEAREELLRLQGVGPKVADCILLMSMDQPSSIPVDRHVFQFAARWYGLRNAKYESLADYFRQRWGEYAGWAHSVLFTADLRSFKDYTGSAKKEEPMEGTTPLAESMKIKEEAFTTVDQNIVPKFEENATPLSSFGTELDASTHQVNGQEPDGLVKQESMAQEGASSHLARRTSKRIQSSTGSVMSSKSSTAVATTQTLQNDSDKLRALESSKMIRKVESGELDSNKTRKRRRA